MTDRPGTQDEPDGAADSSTKRVNATGPALGASDRPVSPHLQSPDFETNERRAVVAEMHQVVRVGIGISAAGGALLLLTLLRASGLLPGTASPTSAADPWAQSMLAVLLLLGAAQVVPVLIVAEHRVGPVLATKPIRRSRSRTRTGEAGTPGARRILAPSWLRAGRGTPAPLAVWTLRILILSLSVAAVATEWMPVDWWTVVGAGAVVGAATLALLLWARHRLPPAGPASGGAPAMASTPGPPVPEEGAPGPEEAGDAQDAVAEASRLLAIGASGGGIRAAAFVLGGTQALQESAEKLGAADPAHEPQVFAVSGGSYTAAALALRRRFDLGGSTVPPAAWTAVYRPGSPELERLRRHTRYLFEPGSRLREGVVALLLGATLNVLVVGCFLVATAWVSVLLAKMLAVVVLVPDEQGRAVDLVVTQAWTTGAWVSALSPTLLAVAAVCVLTVYGWREARVFDRANPTQRRRTEAMETIDRAQRWRPRLLILGVLWIAVVFGLPAGAAGLSGLATGNRPTTAVASMLYSAGFGTIPLCQEALDTSVAEAVDDAEAQARTSPDVPATATAGACGYETTVTRTLNTQGDSDPANDVLPGSGAEVSVGWKPNAAIQLGSVGALLAAVIGLLRRGPSPEAEVAAGWRGRLKRGLLIWLPLATTCLVALYLLLLWTFNYLIELSGPGLSGFVAWSAGLTATAAIVCLLADADATSMHGYYRSRLADAFCVGADEERARELPPERVYRFSELDGVRLNIVATLNSRFPNEAPTMRGGFPFVFSPTTVAIPREERRYIEVATEDFENYAGAGRTSVMAAVAISGAAISPLMGRFGVQIAPYRVLLTLFNLRVGTWVANPLHSRHIDYGVDAVRLAPAPEGWLWLTSKPGLVRLASEALFAVSANERWIYLSDGGHLDNTGLVECVRHCVRTGRTGRIVVLDASNDPPGTWSAVGDAIAVIRADLNLDLRRVVASPSDGGPFRLPAPTLPPWARVYSSGDLDVLVVKAIRVEASGEGGVDWNSRLPPNVSSFQMVTKDFPRAATTRQKFGDLEFEAYRGLGYSATRLALEAAGWVAPTG